MLPQAPLRVSHGGSGAPTPDRNTRGGFGPQAVPLLRVQHGPPFNPYNVGAAGSLAARYSLDGAASDATYRLNGSKVMLIADRSGNSAVNVLANNKVNSNRAYLTTGTAIGTGAFTRSIKFRVPSANPSGSFDGLGFFSGVNTGWAGAGACYFAINTSGDIRFNIRNNADSANALAQTGTLVATYGGQIVVAQFVRSGTTCTTYINGTQLATGSASETTTVVSTITGSGAITSSEIANSEIFWDRTYSVALDATQRAADVAGVVQSNCLVNLDYSTASKLAASFTCATGQTVTVSSTGDLGCRISGARDLVQMTDANRPVLTTVNGYNLATFDGTNDYMKAAPFSLVQPESVYFVGSQVTWTLNDGILDGYTSAIMSVFQSATTPDIRMRASAIGGTNTGMTLGVRKVIAAIFNTSSSVLSVNRGTAVTGDVTGGNGGGFAIGARGDGSNPSNITFSEAIVRPVADAAAMRLNIVGALMTKWGVT